MPVGFNTGLIRNYVVPHIGDRFVRSLTTRDIDAYYTMLLDQPAVLLPGRHDTGARITADTVTRIHKLLKSAVVNKNWTRKTKK